MNQAGPVDGETPVANGRMVRRQDYKYCLYDILDHREALFDLKNDPSETVNIAEEDSSGKVLANYRSYLKEFAEKNRDTLASKMLENTENSLKSD